MRRIAPCFGYVKKLPRTHNKEVIELRNKVLVTSSSSLIILINNVKITYNFL